ncbi:MAG: ATP-binding cassette domain-containing protein [Candidatus Cloacimonetes bacterium]|nr:ATP-binding cassette domain-containing protein [Candidatus Cloacimonadota bacterium]
MIVVKDLVKEFGVHKAVDRISFEIQKGEILGFLGPNGAGKSTTMKMLTCFLAPTSGFISVDGIATDLDPQTVKTRIGYLPETSASYTDMNVTEFLKFIGEVRGFSGLQLAERVEAVIQKCFLESVRFQTIDTLSKGYRQRVGFAQAILHDPPVLILDEPTDGLDPNQKHEVRNLIRNMGKEKCIILSTHILEEVEELCTRVIIISKGRIVADGKPDEIRARSSEYYNIDLSIHQVESNLAATKLKSITGVKAVEVLPSTHSGLVNFRIVPEKHENLLGQVSELARKENWVLENLSLLPGKLDDVFRSLTMEGRA